jgi:hypothetical protein
MSAPRSIQHVLIAILTGAPACSLGTVGTLCDVPLAETTVSTLIVDTDTTTLVELRFTRKPGPDESPAELPSLYLCGDDSVTINGLAARPIERALDEPVYSVTPTTSAPQYSITLNVDNTTLHYTAIEDRRRLAFLTPDPVTDWNAAFARSAPLPIAWSEAAQDDDPVTIELRDEITASPASPRSTRSSSARATATSCPRTRSRSTRMSTRGASARRFYGSRGRARSRWSPSPATR